MKKFVLAMFMALVCAMSMATLAMADGVGDFCNQHYNFGVDHSTCVTCLNDGQGDYAVCICKLYDNLWFRNQGQCVSYIHTF